VSAVQIPSAAQLKLPDATFNRYRLLAIVALVAGLGLIGAGFGSNHDTFARDASFSYLLAFVFWLTLALGGLGFVLIQHLTRSGWSVAVRRTAEAVASTLPAFLVLFVPLIFALHQLYPWTGTDVPEAVAAKRGYLNETFFLIRAAVYLLIWTFLSRRLVKLSVNQDYSGDANVTGRLQAISPVGTLLFALSLTFAAFDWIMSLAPQWYSTIFGVYIFAGAMISIFSLLSLIAVALRRLPEMDKVITIEHNHALGKFLFGFTVFWAYIGFSQYFLIWYSNIPEETIFYKLRFVPGWVDASWALLLGQFVLQFFIMLPREAKRVPAWLCIGSLWALTFHLLDIYWLIMPNRDPKGLRVTLTDIGALLSVGGIFFFLVLRQLRGEALIPLRDPRLEESLAMEN
jgi:hypothetical protein